MGELTADHPEIVDAIRVYQSATDKPQRDAAFAVIADGLRNFISLMLRQYRCPGTTDDDTRQVCLVALMVALDHYDNEREFMPFVTTVIRRRVFTLIKHCNQKHRTIDNTALSIDAVRVDDDGKTLAMIVPAKEEVNLHLSEEASWDLKRLFGQLGPMERKVFKGMVANIGSKQLYTDVAAYVEHQYDLSLNVKQVDNALTRIRNKAEELKSKGVFKTFKNLT